MKTKIPILIAASLLIVSASKAQYGAPCADNRVVIQGQFVIPGRTVIAYNYNNIAREQYSGYNDPRDNQYGRYDDRNDWRAVEYDRYCHENHGYRMSREEYYRNRCDYRARHFYGSQKVVVHRY